MMRIAIITENFLPKLDGVTRTVARLLEHLQATGHQALLLGPESGMEQYAGAEVIGPAGLALPFYPELKANMFRPLFLRRLREFRPEVIHLVDPVMLGAVCRPEWTRSYRRQVVTNEVWHERVRCYLAPMLSDAILMTAEYLLAWMRSIRETHLEEEPRLILTGTLGMKNHEKR